MSWKTFEVNEAGRLDKILTKEIKESRNQVEQLIKEGLVKVNSKIVIKRGKKLIGGDTISYTFKEIVPKEAMVIDFDVEILYEDEVMMVVNKPSGLVVHPAPSVKEPTLVDWLIHKGVSLSTISGEERHGIVHRIDKDTTGALVIAKTNEAHQKLSEQLQDKSMGRYYLAIIDCPLKENGVVEKPIGRNPKNRLKMAVRVDGKEAKSAFCKLSETGSTHNAIENLELIAVKLFTGRTHQIRVHLASLGRHILGDGLYGFKSKKDTIDRVFLHAYKLYMFHPVTNRRMEFIAPLFADMQEFLNQKFNQGDVNEKINPHTIDTYFTAITQRL